MLPPPPPAHVAPDGSAPSPSADATEAVASTAAAAAARAHSAARLHLRLHDAFVTRYTAPADANGGGGRAGLPLHSDQSAVSLNIALNPLDDYDGGGTAFDLVDGLSPLAPAACAAVPPPAERASVPVTVADVPGRRNDPPFAARSDGPASAGDDDDDGRERRSEVVVRAPLGHVVMHPGSVRHRGVEVTRGVRYILALFIRIEGDRREEGP